MDSQIDGAVEMSVPRDVLLSMSQYMNGIDNLVKSNQQWERANEQVLTGRKGMIITVSVQ